MAGNKRRLLLELPLVTVFAVAFGISELGSRGWIRDVTARSLIYGPLSRVSAIITDAKFRLRGARPPQNKIVVVEIDTQSIRELGRWPWSRDLQAELINQIMREKPRVVGLDIMYPDPEPRLPEELTAILAKKGLGALADRFEPDRLLERVVHGYRDRLVLSWGSDAICQPAFEPCPVGAVDKVQSLPPDFERFGFSLSSMASGFHLMETAIPSAVTLLSDIPDVLKASAHQGFVSVFPDVDGTVRRTSLAMLVHGVPHPSLPLEVARVGLGERTQIRIDDRGRITEMGFARAPRNFPVNSLGVAQVNFRGPGGLFTTISARDVLRDEDNLRDEINRKLSGVPKRSVLRDAFVLVGVSALALGDIRSFPFDSEVPGVEGQAYVLENLLTGDLLTSGGNRTLFVLLLLMTVGVFSLCTFAARLEAIPTLLLFGGVILGIGVLDTQLLFPNGENWNTGFLYAELVTAAFALLGFSYVIEEQDRKFLKLAFSRYVAPAVVDSIVRDHGQLRLGGQKKNLTIMFSDIRSFTTFSERMDARALAEFLNAYLSVMTNLVFAHKGTLDKYIGDAVMAFWGAPLDFEDHAASACAAARAMMVALHNHQKDWKEKYGVDVHIGVGINTAIVNVGNMGSETSFGYTVIGDGVNLASRLEGATKAYGVSILTTQATLDDIVKSGHPLPPHRILDDLKVKGKLQAVRIAQILDRDLDPEGLRLFDLAREAYVSQRWDDAIALFHQANRLLVPGVEEEILDGPCRVFIDRCEEFKMNPPERLWDGGWKLDSK